MHLREYRPVNDATHINGSGMYCLFIFFWQLGGRGAMATAKDTKEGGERKGRKKEERGSMKMRLM